MLSLFISGTDTDVGKTIVSAALLTYFYKRNKKASYFKPIQTGFDQDSDQKTVAWLVGGENNISINQGLTFTKPLSPHLAAYYDNANIDTLKLKENTFLSLNSAMNLVEGAGGLLVPIWGSYLMINFIKDLGLPCVLVARSGLGTINHTLLSLEALRLRHIPIFGVVMVGLYNRDNELAIKRYGRINNVFSMPWLKELAPTSLKDMVNKHERHIEKFLGV
jgi:dethiobiotin synthetase